VLETGLTYNYVDLSVLSVAKKASIYLRIQSPVLCNGRQTYLTWTDVSSREKNCMGAMEISNLFTSPEDQ
jgi:hypothetical protein